ncbi:MULTISPECIES: hypothetical protein [unclassified Pseudoalteromonas]|uniref:hypothetical protein n=1 Tax=unclassified Pseudoalteromonas TaxID=194690 RepID=UPI002097D689|nr:hypothetical protein [Pseudoalteromonas sp. XMcav2-N]MCO7190456.1 hypothetical protein [Pseudoalteromonas sp. XMcav2-N]
MNIEDVRNGEWVEYHKHPVEVLSIDKQHNMVTIYDARSQSKVEVHIDELKDDPQCHCDSYLYF